MRYWWVNQNQTYRHEVLGHYLWSPKRKKNGHANAYYDFMREVAPGDVVLSFADTRIKAIGIARSNAYEAPKPLEFGQTGAYWEQIGWRVDVGFIELRRPIRPSEYMDVLAPLLPSKYAPLRSIGTGLQSVYLTRLPEALAAALIDLIGVEARDIIRGNLLTGVDGARGHRPCGPRVSDASRGGVRATRSASMERMACSSRPMPTLSSLAASSASRTTGVSWRHPLALPRPL